MNVHISHNCLFESTHCPPVWSRAIQDFYYYDHDSTLFMTYSKSLQHFGVNRIGPRLVVATKTSKPGGIFALALYMGQNSKP